MNWYLKVWKNYANFNGRARRKEYWMFILFNAIISYGLQALVFVDESLALLSGLYSLAVLIPSIAVAVRRMHDVGKSGWFLLIPIYNLILAATNGDEGSNEYGVDPKNGNGEELIEDFGTETQA